MSILKEYETKVLYLLASDALAPQQIELLLSEGEFVSYDYTGCGYFLSIQHPILPRERIVCDRPIVTGSDGEVICGFVIFIEDGQLTIECHSWGDVDVPEWFRDRDVQVVAT